MTRSRGAQQNPAELRLLRDRLEGSSPVKVRQCDVRVDIRSQQQLDSTSAEEVRIGKIESVYVRPSPAIDAYDPVRAWRVTMTRPLANSF